MPKHKAIGFGNPDKNQTLVELCQWFLTAAKRGAKRKEVEKFIKELQKHVGRPT